MFTLGYPFRPWRGPKSIADGDDDPATTSRRPPPSTASTQHIRFRTKVVDADWSQRRGAAGPSGRWTPRTASRATMTCGFLYSAPATTTTTTATARVPRPRGLRGRGRAPAVLARGPRLRRQAGRRHRQRRHRGDPGAGDGRAGRARDHAAAHPDLDRPRCPARDTLADGLRAKLPAEAARTGSSGPRTSCSPRASTSSAGAAPSSARRLLRRRRCAAAWTTRRYVDEHFTPPYDPWDQRLCVVPDGDLFRRSPTGRAEVVTDHIDTLRRPRASGCSPAGCSRPTSSSPRPGCAAAVRRHRADASTASRSTSASSSSTAGVMLTRRAELRVLHRLHQRLLDAARRPDLTAGLPAAQPPGRATATPSAAPRRRRRARARPLLDLTSGYVQRAIDRFPQQGDRGPWRVRQNYVLDRRRDAPGRRQPGHDLRGRDPPARPLRSRSRAPGRARAGDRSTPGSGCR